MVNVKTEIEINRNLDEVVEYASNPDNAPEWYVNIKSVEWVTQKPLRIGSQIAFKAKFLGRELSYTYEIMELIKGEKLVMSTAQGPFPMETTYTWKSKDEATTLMTLQNRGIPKGFSRVFAPFMASAIKKANKKDLSMLKNILESKS